jgi:hypothetical protein
MRFAKYVFRIAGVYGLLVTFPLYFMEQRNGLSSRSQSSRILLLIHWCHRCIQILFFFVASDPVRYRPLMFLCVLEKVSLVPTFFILFPQGRYPVLGIPFVVIDLAFGILFVFAYIKTKGLPNKPAATGA